MPRALGASDVGSTDISGPNGRKLSANSAPADKTQSFLAGTIARLAWKGTTTATTPGAVTAAVLGLAFTTAPPPTITGTKISGSTLTAVTGTWSPSSGVTFTYVWKRASTSAGTKTTITGATSKTYRLVTADKGKYLTVTVVASKTGYASTSQTSADGGTKIAS